MTRDEHGAELVNLSASLKAPGDIYSMVAGKVTNLVQNDPDLREILIDEPRKASGDDLRL